MRAAAGGSLVGEAVGELLEELVAGQVRHNNPLAHGQGLRSCRGNHIAGGRVHENPVLMDGGIQVISRAMEHHRQLLLSRRRLQLQLHRHLQRLAQAVLPP